MKIKGLLILNYKTENDASLIYNSLEVDNEHYLKSSINKNTVKYKIDSESLGSFLSTIDDLISSEIVCEKIMDKTKQL